MISLENVHKNLDKVRAGSPLVHSITNFVVMNTTANALLSVGASPIMAHAPEEMDEITAIVGALVLNIGTLTTPWIESMVQAGKAAAKRPIPVVFDPVGAGASTLRTETSVRIMNECAPTIVRGNAFEVLTVAAATGAVDSARVQAALAEAGESRGVDSAHSGEGIADIARALAGQAKCTVVISGPVDTVTDGERVARITGGSKLMPKVTGMGCTATALCGAFAAVVTDPFEAAVSAMVVMSAAGAKAAAKANGPGTLQAYFCDALYNIMNSEIDETVRLEMQ